MNSQLVYPPRLKDGDTVGVVAPASPFDRKTFKKGVGALKSLGLKPVLADGLYKKNGYLAGSERHRAKQIESFFTDEAIKGIICARGGFGSIHLLSHLNFNVINRYPKCFIGFSDITALLSIIYTKTKLVTFHGPTVTALAGASKISLYSFLSALTSDIPSRIPTSKGVALRSGKVTGTVVGGNLTTLCHLLGTPFQPDFSGCILLVEDVSESEYRIDRMLTQMKLAGCFKGIVGLGLGSFRRCGSIKDIHGIFKRIFKEYKIPILGGLPVGHYRTNLTVPFGLTATLDTKGKSLTFLEAATK